MEFKLSAHIIILVLCLTGSEIKSQEAYNVNHNSYRETVWLESDRHLYLSGEIISFRAHVFEQDTYHNSWLSNNLRVELLDPSGAPVIQQNLKLDEAKLSGNIQLPEDAKTGWYYLRSYTNWMRNFPSSGFGYLPIKVVNPSSVILDSIARDLRPLKIKLFQKGNENGIFAGINDSQGVKISGWIINEKGDTLSPFSTHDSGWGYLEENLPVNESYRIIVDGLNKEEYSETTIAIFSGEPIVKIQDNEQHISVTISDLGNTRNENMRLIVHQSYTIFWESDHPINSETGLIIPKNKLPAGIIQLSLLGEDNQVIAKRLWSDYHIKSTRIEVSTGESEFQIRNSYSMNLQQSGINNNVSVFIGLDEPCSPLKIFIPGLPGWNCNSSIPNNPQAFKGWLLGNSYSDELVSSLSDSDLDRSQNIQMKHLPETRTGLICGQVINKNTGKGVSNTGICINILNDNYFDAATTETDGRFYFALPGYTGSTDYILNLTSIIDSALLIELTPLYDPRPNDLLSNFGLSDEELQYLNIQSTNLQLQRIYSTQSQLQNRPLNSFQIKNTFFHPTDFNVVVDDYIKLANIREVIYEVVPNVVVRNKNGREYLKVYNDHPFSANYETLVLLDGIPLTNHKHLLDLPPDRIDIIEVKDKLYIHGRTIFSSLVNFVSPNKDYAGLDLPENSILSTLDLPEAGVQLQISKHDRTSTLPQLANTLLWDSEVSFKNPVQFNTNDLTGNFQILVYGFDNSGHWVCGKHSIVVSNEK